MQSKLLLFVFAMALAAAPAAAEPLKIRNAEMVRVRVGGQSQRGVTLRARPEGWRVELAGSSANGTAELIDVTPGTPARTLAVALNGDELLLDAGRFVGGHVYRVQLRRSGSPLEAGLVYLQPGAPPKEPPVKAQAQRIKFVGDEAPPSSSNDIQPVSKSPL